MRQLFGHAADRSRHAVLTALLLLAGALALVSGCIPGDQASRLYVERCALLAQNPPDDAWDGVWVMTSK